MVIIGVNLASTKFKKNLHDGGVCVIIDSEIKMAVAEERITRKKRDGGFKNSLSYVLTKLNLTPRDVDLIVYSSCCEHFHETFTINGLKKVKTVGCNHHFSHALSVYLTSPFDEAIILVLDAGGDVIDKNNRHEWWRLYREQHSYFIAKDNNIILLERDFERPESAGIGEVYRAFTYYLGWHSSRHTNKTMALSAYGDSERFKNKNIFYFNNSGQMFSHIRNNPSTPLSMVEELLKKYQISNILPREPRGEILQQHKDLATWLQMETEKAIFQKINYLINKTGISNVCLSGGVAYNCSVIGKIYSYTSAKNVYIHPASGDHGQCLGNAIYGNILNKKSWRRSHIFNPFLGGEEEISLNKIHKLTKNFHDSLIVHQPPNITDVVAELLKKGEIVAWFQGRSEYGPRALGNRSIIANPSFANNKQPLNKIKGRENFNPFAPSVLAENADDYFQCVESPYMTTAFKVNQNIKDKIPAVVHYDDTARIQTVKKEISPLFYELIYKFYLITQTPLVLNTSFNNPGEPIVETLEDAMRTFLNLDIKYFATGRFLIKKVYRKITEDILVIDLEFIYQIDLSKNKVLDEKKLRDILKSRFSDLELFPRQKILLYEEFIKWIKRGYKTTTIRYKRGGIDFPVKNTLPLYPTKDFSSETSESEARQVKISKFSIKRFKDLGDQDARKDGFNNLEELKKVLFNIYGKINEDEYISIYNIDLI